MSLNPYLYSDGQCEEAFQFYEKCFDGKITFMMTYEGSPMAGQAPPDWAKKILHAGLALGDGPELQTETVFKRACALALGR